MRYQEVKWFICITQLASVKVRIWNSACPVTSVLYCFHGAQLVFNKDWRDIIDVCTYPCLSIWVKVSLAFQCLSMAWCVSLLVVLHGVLAFQTVSSHCGFLISSLSRASKFTNRNAKPHMARSTWHPDSDTLDIKLTLAIVFPHSYAFLYWWEKNSLKIWYTREAILDFFLSHHDCRSSRSPKSLTDGPPHMHCTCTSGLWMSSLKETISSLRYWLVFLSLHSFMFKFVIPAYVLIYSLLSFDEM